MSACNLIVLTYEPQHNSATSSTNLLNVHIIMLSFEKWKSIVDIRMLYVNIN